MAKPSKRNLRKNIVQQIEETFDLQRLNYGMHIKPVRNKAKLDGALVAFLVYGLGFTGGYYSWQHQVLDYETFAKLVWILMIPATVIGMFVWLLATNRREFAIREDVRTYIRELEGEHGLLWRFSPLLSALKPDEFACKSVMQASWEKNFEKMMPEDYSQAVLSLYEIVKRSGNRKIGPEAAEEFMRNLEHPKPSNGSFTP